MDIGTAGIDDLYVVLVLAVILAQHTLGREDVRRDLLKYDACCVYLLDLPQNFDTYVQALPQVKRLLLLLENA